MSCCNPGAQRTQERPVPATVPEITAVDRSADVVVTNPPATPEAQPVAVSTPASETIVSTKAEVSPETVAVKPPAPVQTPTHSAGHALDERAFDLKTKSVVSKRGPYGVEVRAGETYYYCTCGRSKTQPFCDGSHVTYNREVGASFAPLPFTAKHNGVVHFCGCRRSAQLPLCDGSHVALPQALVGAVPSGTFSRRRMYLMNGPRLARRAPDPKAAVLERVVSPRRLPQEPSVASVRTPRATPEATPAGTPDAASVADDGVARTQSAQTPSEQEESGVAQVDPTATPASAAPDYATTPVEVLAADGSSRSASAPAASAADAAADPEISSLSSEVDSHVGRVGVDVSDADECAPAREITEDTAAVEAMVPPEPDVHGAIDDFFLHRGRPESSEVAVDSVEQEQPATPEASASGDAMNEASPTEATGDEGDSSEVETSDTSGCTAGAAGEAVALVQEAYAGEVSVAAPAPITEPVADNGGAELSVVVEKQDVTTQLEGEITATKPDNAVPPAASAGTVSDDEPPMPMPPSGVVPSEASHNTQPTVAKEPGAQPEGASATSETDKEPSEKQSDVGEKQGPLDEAQEEPTAHEDRALAIEDRPISGTDAITPVVDACELEKVEGTASQKSDFSPISAQYSDPTASNGVSLLRSA